MDINEIFYNINFKDINSFRKYTNKCILKSNKNIKRLETEQSYISFINILSNDITLSSNINSLINLLINVSNNKRIINLCSEYLYILDCNTNKIYSNKIIYNKIVKIYNNNNISKLQKDFLEKIIKTYKLEGIELDENKKKEFNKIKNNIINLENNISNNIMNDESRIIGLTKENTERIFKCEFIETLPIINNKPLRYGISLNDFNYNLLISNVINDNLRHKIENIYNNKCCNNTYKIIELLLERKKMSNILSYDNFLHYKLEKQFENDKNKIEHILLTIYDKIKQQYNQEINMLLKLKKTHCKKRNSIFKKILNKSDIQYYLNKWKKEYGINNNKLSEYFPLNKVFPNIIKIYEGFFNIRFQKIKLKQLWDDSVLTYKIYDQDNNLLGLVLFDLYFRLNKSNIIQFYELKTGCLYPLFENKEQLPVSCLVSNFSKDKNNNILLNIGDLLILFCEFGNIIQNLYSFNSYSLLSGVSNKSDYNKIVTYIFENIFWNEDIIKKLSNHYITNKTIEDELTLKIINSRNINNGIYYKYQIMLSIFDIIINSSNNIHKYFLLYSKISNIEEKNKKCNNLMYTLFKNLHTQFFLKDSDIKIEMQNNNYFPSLWNHTISNNSSLYYSNIWNDIVASDIYLNKIKNNNNYIFNKDFLNFLINFNYKNPINNIKEYIGHVPTIEAFCNLKNINLDDNNSIFFTPKTNLNSTTNNNINSIQIINIKKKCFTISDDDSYSTDEDVDKSFNEFNTINNFSENIIENNYNNLNNIIETDTENLQDSYSNNNSINEGSINKNIFVKNNNL